MTKTRHEHSLRNQQVGEAYMIMLDVYEKCSKVNMPTDLIIKEIDMANPWGVGKEWQHRAWKIALREFYKDYGFPRYPQQQYAITPVIEEP